MMDTLWFTTKSNGVLRHALTGAERAACNARIRPNEFPVRNAEGVTTHVSHDGKPVGQLPEWAELCPRCEAKVDQHANRNQDTFTDWDGGGTELELTDNGDSLSVSVRLVGSSATLEVDVRVRPADLDRLERRIREIRAARGI